MPTPELTFEHLRCHPNTPSLNHCPNPKPSQGHPLGQLLRADAEAAADASVLAGVLIHPVGQLLKGLGFAGGRAEEIKVLLSPLAESDALNDRHLNMVILVTNKIGLRLSS